MYYETDDLKATRVRYKHQKQYRILVLDKRTGKFTKGTNARWNQFRTVKEYTDSLQRELDKGKNIYGILRLVFNFQYKPKSKKSGVIIAEVQIDLTRHLGTEDMAGVTLEAINRRLIVSSELLDLCRSIVNEFIQRDIDDYEVSINTAQKSITSDTDKSTSVVLIVRGREYSQPNGAIEDIIDNEIEDIV